MSQSKLLKTAKLIIAGAVLTSSISSCKMMSKEKHACGSKDAKKECKEDKSMCASKAKNEKSGCASKTKEEKAKCSTKKK